MKAMRCVEPNTKTISRSADSGIRVYHFIMDLFFVLCARSLLMLLLLSLSLLVLFSVYFSSLQFFNSLSELLQRRTFKDTDMTIILWITKCNYCPPTKFLIYDQILDPFKSCLICSGAVAAAALEKKKTNNSKWAAWLRLCCSKNATTCFSTQKKIHIFHSDRPQQML